MKIINNFLSEQITTTTEAVVTTSLGDKIKIQCEIASTPEQIQKGLMGRNELAERCGMLFIFSKEDNHEFWMKDTLIPLDIIFIREDKYITEIIENTTPESIKMISIESPSKFVIEVNAGFCCNNGIRRSDTIEFKIQHTQDKNQIISQETVNYE